MLRALSYGDACGLSFSSRLMVGESDVWGAQAAPLGDAEVTRDHLDAAVKLFGQLVERIHSMCDEGLSAPTVRQLASKIGANARGAPVTSAIPCEELGGRLTRERSLSAL